MVGARSSTEWPYVAARVCFWVLTSVQNAPGAHYALRFCRADHMVGVARCIRCRNRRFDTGSTYASAIGRLIDAMQLLPDPGQL